MKKWFIPLLVALVGLTLVLVLRGMSYGHPPATHESVETLPLRDDEHIQRLSTALTFPTITYDERDKIDWTAFDKLHAHLEASFPLVYSQLTLTRVNTYGLLFHWQGSDTTLDPYLLMAHQDVVPVVPGTEQEWAQPPFSGAVDATYVWGRGAIDDKASVMAIFEAVEALLARGHQPKRSLFLAFGQDEEIGGDEGAKSMAEMLKKQGVRLHFVLDEGGLVVNEEMLEGIDKKVAMVGVAEKGYVTLELKARGKGGHSSMPPRQTAVGVLSQAITRLENNPMPPNTAFIEKTFSSLGTELPFVRRVIFGNMWLFRPLVRSMVAGQQETNAMVRTTTAATMFSGSIKENVLPIEAVAVVNFRIIPGETPDTVVAHVRKVIDNPEISIDIRGFASAPSPVSPSQGPVWEMMRTSILQTGRDMNLRVAPFLVVGATDARHFTGLSNHIYRFLFIVNGPGDVSRFHGTNERIAIHDYERATRFYQRVILNNP